MAGLFNFYLIWKEKIMIPEYVVTPVVGAVIGYFTNWLAIKMIFRPYTEKRIFNMRVPFTPGLMAKERYVLSKKVGVIISENLLTEEVMVKALISDDIHNNIISLVDKGLDILKNQDITILEAINNFVDIEKNSNYNLSSSLENKISSCIIEVLQKDDLQNNALDFIFNKLEILLKKQVKDMPLEKISSYIETMFSNYGIEYINSVDFENLIEDNMNIWKNNLNEKLIGEIISEEAKEKIKLSIENKVPSVSKLILNLIETPIIEEKLKEIIINLIDENVGKFVSIFISSSKVSESIIESLKKYLTDENNYPKTSQMLIAYIEKLSSMKINEITEKIPKDYKEYPISDVLIKTIRKFCTEENVSNIFKSINKHIIDFEDKNIYDIIKAIEPDIMNKGKLYLKEQLEKIVKGTDLHLYIKKIVNSQVNMFMNMTLGDLSKKVTQDNINKIKIILLRVYDFMIQKAMLNMLKAMNISKIVEDRINDFEIEEAENIVLQVVDRELKSITLIGGVLGFVIGLLPILIN